MVGNMFNLVIQTDNGTIDVKGSRDEVIELFNVLVTARRAGETTLIVNTPLKLPMMFNPQSISHLGITG